MNRIPNRKRFMAFYNPHRFQKSEKYRGELEPMSMEFQGKYLDSESRMADPKVYEFYRRDVYGGQHYPSYGQGASQNYTCSPHASSYTRGDLYPRSGRQMYFPERYMDLSNYQMDLKGRWMDMQGRYVNPFSSNNYWRRNNSHWLSPQLYSNNDSSFMSNPERYKDMSGYQMDSQGRWMDLQGRYTSPFSSNQVGLQGRQNVHRNHPYMCNTWRFMYWPERYLDMSGYQMDMGGRWMDRQGRHCNPMYQWGMNRQGLYPFSSYNRNMFYPERMMDMSNYQMDMQGSSMDRYGHHLNPFSGHSCSICRNTNSPGRNYYERYANIPERSMDMSGYQMDMNGRWMDVQGRHCNPFSQWGCNRQGPYPGYPHIRNMAHPEKMMDMSNYQMDMQGRWMDMQGRYSNPFNYSDYSRHGSYPGYPHMRNMAHPEKMMDMSNYQMDMQGRWMDMQGRYSNPFNYSSYNRHGNYPGQGRKMSFHDRSMDMPNYHMEIQGRYSQPFDHYMPGMNMQQPFNNENSSRYGDYPERYMDMPGNQVELPGRLMDMPGGYNQPFDQGMHSREGFYPGHPYSRNTMFPERSIDMSNHQMDADGRWMDNYGRYGNPGFGFGGQGNTFGDYFRSSPGSHVGDDHKYMGVRNMYDRNQFQQQYGYHH